MVRSTAFMMIKIDCSVMVIQRMVIPIMVIWKRKLTHQEPLNTFNDVMSDLARVVLATGANIEHVIDGRKTPRQCRPV